MQLKDFLKRKPQIAVRFMRAGLLSSMLWGVYYNYIQHLPDQDFTKEETQQLTHIFQKSVDFSVINYNQSNQGDAILKLHSASGLTLGNTFIVSTDLKPKSFHYQNTLIHEATHIWQKQNCSFSSLSQLFSCAQHFLSDPIEIYKYRLDAEKDLLDYNNEQQASIVADYFNYKTQYPSIFIENQGPDEEIKTLYRAVLRNFLQDPNYIKQQCGFSI